MERHPPFGSDPSEASQDEQRLWGAAFQHCAHGISIAVAATGRILACNPALARIHGRSVEEMFGMPLLEMYPPRAHEAVCERLAESDRVGWVQFEQVMVRKDGSLFDAQVHLASVYDDVGAPAYRVATIEDISERKRAEGERAQLEMQLRQVQKLDAIGRITAQVAHDFNNLLTVIRSQAEAAMEKVAEPNGARPFITFIQTAANQAVEITTSLLTFSRAMPASKRRVDLCSVLRDASSLLRHSLPARIELELDASSDCNCIVVADPTQMQQLLLNLALNARDAMPRGGKLRIAITTASAVHPTGGVPAEFVRLTIADTGAGIAAEVRSCLFEPFVTTKPRGQGTGLGLSIVHGIVTAHGGWIEVQSEPGKGAAFAVMLPCAAPRSAD